MAAIAPDTAFDIAKLYASVGAIAWLCCGRCFIHIASALETTAMFRPKSSSRCAKALIPLQSQNRSILAMTFGPTKFRSTPGYGKIVAASDAGPVRALTRIKLCCQHRR